MRRRHILLIALVALAGGSIPPFAKLALESFEPFTLVFIRFLLASIVIYFFLPKRELSLATLVKLRWTGIIGALNPIFIFLALQYIPSNITALFYAVVPGMSVVYLLVTKHARTSLLQIGGFALGLIGVGIVSLHTAATSSSDNPYLGVLFASIAAISFFAYGIMSKEKQRTEGISGTALAFYFAVITTVISIPFAIIETAQNPWLGHVSVFPLLGALYLGLIGTGVQYLLYQRALKVMEAAQANIFIYLQPIITVILSALVVHEVITWQVFVGGVVVLLGARLALAKPKKPLRAPAEP